MYILVIEGNTMEDNLPQEEPRELSEVEEWELERKLLALAYENSYLVLTERCTFEDLMVENHQQGKSALLAHDPHEGPSCKEINGLIQYYLEDELYERCAELKPLLKECCEL